VEDPAVSASDPQNLTSIKAEKGNNSGDVRQNFTVNVLLTCRSVRAIGSLVRALAVSCSRGGGSQRSESYAQASPIPSTSGRTPSGTAISSISDRIASLALILMRIRKPLPTGSTRHFSMPVPGTLGNCGRDTIYGPSVRNVHFSMLKESTLGENCLEFRVEFLNVFNHPAFAQPDTTFGTLGFGEIFNTLGNTLCAGTSRQIQFALKFSF
jgi:hypothetical protein